ncbi:unnamed protein product [Aphanomyces euteiches]
MRQRTRGGNVPEAKRLIHFTKPTIQAKTSTRIHMHVSIHDLSIYVNHIGDGLKRRMVRTTKAAAAAAGVVAILIPRGIPPKDCPPPDIGNLFLTRISTPRPLQPRWSRRAQ